MSPKHFFSAFQSSISEMSPVHLPGSPPVWCMRQAGRYLPEYQAVRHQAGGFLNLCYTPTLAKEVTLQPIRRFGLDAAIIFSDILVIPDILGQGVEFLEEQGPVLSPLHMETIREGIMHFQHHPRLQRVYEAIALTVAELEHTAMIGFVGAPWTLACYMLEGKSGSDFLKSKQRAFQQDGTLEELIEILVSACTMHAFGQIEAGCEVIQIFDSWAGILPPQQFHDYVIIPNGAIIRSIRAKYPHIPIIAFPRGSGQQNLLDFCRFAEPDGISLDSTVSRSWAVETIPELVVLQGNLDPVVLCTDRVTIKREVAAMKDAWKTRPVIINLGHGVLKQTPPEHMAWFVQCVRECI